MNIWNNKNWGPMLLDEQEKPFDAKDYYFEVKFDGIRAIVFASPKEVIIKTRNNQDVTNLYPELQSIKNLVSHNTIFDGEIVSFQDGKPSFQKLQERSHLKKKDKILKMSITHPVYYVCFDILYDNGDLTNKTLEERKKILGKIKDNDEFIKNKYIENNGIKLFKEIKKLGLEGIIAKRKDSVYQINTRVKDWIKIKNFQKALFYIGGYKENEDSFVISLALGEFTKKGFHYVGNVSMAKKNPLYKKIKLLRTRKLSTFTDYTNDELSYIKPEYKCLIYYIERTKNNHLRQPIFKKEEL